ILTWADPGPLPLRISLLDILPPSDTILASSSFSSLSLKGLASKSTGSDISETPINREYQAEAAILGEVEDFIGAPDDWTGSEDRSLIENPFEVGRMKTGFIDEDLLEENLDLLDLEEAVADFGFEEDTDNPFVYDSSQGSNH